MIATQRIKSTTDKPKSLYDYETINVLIKYIEELIHNLH